MALLDSEIVSDAACSVDLRERVVGATEAGGSRRAAARVFRISASTASARHRVKVSGSRAAKRTGGDVRSRKIETRQDRLLAMVDAEPDLTLEVICGRLSAEQSFRASVSVVLSFAWRVV